MANRNWASGGKIYSMHVKPVLLDTNFKVSAADSAGYGITSLKGPCISQVYMHSTAATPNALNPASGTIVVQLSDAYSGFYAHSASIQSPGSGSDLAVTSGLTVGRAYVISVLGTTSAAEWITLGLPAGFTAAVGTSFIAASTGTGSSTGKVQISAATGSGVASIEIFGNPGQTLNPDPSKNQGYGGQFIFQCRDYAGALVAPADNSVISIRFYVSDSSVLIGGE
jgi:hypothetical protein